MTRGTPAAEIEINEELVRQLMRLQFSHLADLPLKLADQGWDNITFRLGSHLAVRLPRRQMAARLIENEQTFLPGLGPLMPIPTPVPIHLGMPEKIFPWRWSIVPWLDGETADVSPPAAAQAIPFAQFLLALHHHPGPEIAPRNDFRGIPLIQKAKVFEERLARLRSRDDFAGLVLSRLWGNATSTPPATTACWLHGDLHARNVVVCNGEITGVIDWGDLTSGDPATDLAAVWSLFEEPEARRLCLDHYRATPEDISRAKGWASFFAVVLLETGLIDHPAHAEMGRAILNRLAADE